MFLQNFSHINVRHVYFSFGKKIYYLFVRENINFVKEFILFRCSINNSKQRTFFKQIKNGIRESFLVLANLMQK